MFSARCGSFKRWQNDRFVVPGLPPRIFLGILCAMKKKHSAINPRPFSSILFDGDERAAARAMLYPVGFKEEDFKKPLIGVASTWSDVTPCNMHIDKLALESEKGVNEGGGKAIIFNTITISDGISMGTEGMKYSLVSREVIADSIETVVGCAGMDGYVAIGGCDKNMPGSLIAIARMNRPAVFVYGGTILPGCITGDTRKLDIVSVFEAVGAHANHKITEDEFKKVEQCAIPGAGSCGGMYTANTMASAIEALGMSLPNSSAQNAVSPAKLAASAPTPSPSSTAAAPTTSPPSISSSNTPAKRESISSGKEFQSPSANPPITVSCSIPRQSASRTETQRPSPIRTPPCSATASFPPSASRPSRNYSPSPTLS